MALNKWTGNTTAVAQIATVQITAFDAATTYKLTLTDDLGNAVVISAVGTTDVNATAAALQAAWAAATDPRVGMATAIVATDTITLTSTVAGRPFNVASSVTGGAGTIGAVTDTTDSSGPNDVGVPANWSLNAVPVATDDVEIPAGTPAMLYGLDLAGVAIGAFKRAAGHITDVGRFEFGFRYPLRIDPDSFEDYGGATLSMFDIGSAAITPRIASTSKAATGRYAVHIKGTAMPGIDVVSGVVGLGVDSDDTTTEVDNIRVIAGELTIGAGVKNTAAGAITSITQQSGAVNNHADVTTGKLWGGTYTQVEGKWTSMTVYGGTAYTDSDGAYGATIVKPLAAVLNTNDLRTKTMVDLTVEKNGIFEDPSKLITFTNDVQFPDGDAQVATNFGSGIKYKPVAI